MLAVIPTLNRLLIELGGHNAFEVSFCRKTTLKRYQVASMVMKTSGCHDCPVRALACHSIYDQKIF
jgi:hypothetical protein